MTFELISSATVTGSLWRTVRQLCTSSHKHVSSCNSISKYSPHTHTQNTGIKWRRNL